MASVVAKQLLYSGRNFSPNSSPFAILIRNSSKSPKKKCVKGTIKYRNLIDSTAETLSDRGFLRSQKPYSPPPNAVHKFEAIVAELFGPDVKPEDPIPKTEKFRILERFWKEFDHGIPNSQLHKICCFDDVLKFYTTEVITKSPYDLMKEKDLPPNLHLVPDYVRFDPETDTKFGGITAYPMSPTIITSLKSKKKYKSTRTRLPYYYHNEAVYIGE